MKVLEHQHLCYEESWDCSAWSRKGRGVLTDVHKFQGFKEARALFSSVLPSERHWAHRRPHENIWRNTFTVWVSKDRLPRGAIESSPLESSSKAAWTWSKARSVALPGRLGSFSSQSFVSLFFLVFFFISSSEVVLKASNNKL